MTELSQFELPKKRKDGENLEERMTENAYQRILPARYLNKDEQGNVVETPEELFERVAENVAQPAKEYGAYNFEETKQEFYELMTELKFMPNSPTLMNMGDELQMGSACFVLHPEDDMENIFNTARDAALTFKDGGGMGYPFHLLRPKGDIVKSTGGISSGPMSFMQVFDTTCSTIKQGGVRRGAQMGIMRVDHPDILRFIVSKRKEGNLANFNISVGFTDDFMEAVKNDEEYELINPRTGDVFETSRKTVEFYSSNPGDYPEAQGSDTGKDDNFWRDFAENFESDVEPYRDHLNNLEEGEPFTLPAKFIFEAIVDGAWRNGEPGFYNYSEYNTMHSYDIEEKPEKKIEACNPSLRAGTRVLTENGVKNIEELEDKKFRTPTLTGEWADAECWLSGENEELYKVKSDSGISYYATKEHKWPVKDGDDYTKKTTTELDHGDYMPMPEKDNLGFGSKGEEEEGFLLGYLYGDGSITQRRNGKMQYGFTFNEQAANDGTMQRVITKLEDITGQTYNPEPRNRGGENWFEVHSQSQKLAQKMKQLGAESKSKGLPGFLFEEASEEFRKAFIDGLFSTDGSVDLSNNRLKLDTSREEIAEDVSDLLGMYGVKNFYNSKTREMNGEHYTLHTVTIGLIAAHRFKELFSLTNKRKQKQLEELKTPQRSNVRANHFKVDSVEKTGEKEKVWDVSVNHPSHSFTLPHVITGNCGEQGLMNGEACNLGHVNLSLLVEDEASKYEEFEAENGEYPDHVQKSRGYLKEALDIEELERICRTGTRFLDNVVSMNDWPTEEIKETAEKNRKIGLGLMGFAQMLIQMGVRYGSDESIALAKEVQRIITKFSVQESHELAKTKGKFPDWDESKWAEPAKYEDWFEVYAPEVDTEKHSDGYPVRNHNMVTIAPTGTTSMLGDTSGGCEPIFSLAYFKNVAKDIQGEDMLVEFDDYFLKALEHNDVDVEQVKQDAQEKMENNEWEGVQSISDDILPPRVKKYFATADQVTPEEHMEIQAAFQEHNHSGISKTCNFPNTATREDVKEAYLKAHELGIKGMTVYRNGSRDVQVMQENKDNKVVELIDVKQFIDDADTEEIQEIKEKIKGGEN